nr:helix-turn-helix transcriptional regulator [Acetobacter ascendens]
MTRSPVADELERRMALLGLSQKALARKAGVGDTYVRDILKGKSRNPGGEKLECIAAVLGCTARDLLFPGVDHAQPGLMLRERRTPYLPPPFTPATAPTRGRMLHSSAQPTRMVPPPLLRRRCLCRRAMLWCLFWHSAARPLAGMMKRSCWAAPNILKKA